MELCRINLLFHVNSLPGHYATEASAVGWALQLFEGLSDLYRLGILHRDIKPENLLLTFDDTLKISDFGWCAHVSEKPISLAGTFQSMAPEVLEELEPQTEAVDVWSAGCAIIQLLIGRAFLSRATGLGPTGLSTDDPNGATRVRINRLLEEIAEVCPLLDDERPDFLSPACWDFLRQSLTPDVNYRMTVHEALAHEWFQGLA
jgi:serine/threonine protein kinase